MNIIGTLLSASRYGDDIKPEFSKEMMGEYIDRMHPLEFEMLCDRLKIAAAIQDVIDGAEAWKIAVRPLLDKALGV